MPATGTTHKIGVRSIAQNAGFLVFSRVSEKAIRFIYVMILARWLGPELLGLYNYGLAWYLIFLPIGFWGLGVLLSVYLGRKPKDAEDVVAVTFLIRVITTLAAAFFCFIIGFISNDDPITRNVISIFVIALVGRSMALWGRDCFIAVERSHYSAGLEIGFRLLEVSCGLVYFSVGGGIIGLCVIHSACWVAEGVLALSLVRWRLNFRKILVPWNRIYPYAIEAFPIAANIFLFTALFQSGFIVLKHISTDALDLGYYTVAFQLVANTVIIPQAFGQAALPILSRAHSRGAGESIVFFEVMLKICSLSSAALVMCVIVYGTYILELLFGEKYLNASGALIVCSIAMIPYYALAFAHNMLNASGNYALAAVNIGIALMVSIIITVVLSPMGQVAPAFGLLVGAVAALMFHLIVIHKKIGRISWRRAIVKPYVSAIIAITVTWHLKQFGVFGLGAGIAFLIGCFTFCKMFTAQEIGYFAKLMPWLQRA
jgi:O-antigen/teichoic acid export membrane protein